MESSETTRIFSVNGLPSSGKHELVKRIKTFHKVNCVVEFSEEDVKDFLEAFGESLDKKEKTKKKNFLSASFKNYNRKMKQALNQKNNKIIVTINDPFFLSRLYWDLSSPVFSKENIKPYLKDYNEMIEPHQVIRFTVKCKPTDALENWIKKTGGSGSFLTKYDFLEMFNNLLFWIHVDALQQIVVKSKECIDWSPS